MLEPATPSTGADLVSVELAGRQLAHQIGGWHSGRQRLDSSLPNDLWTGGKIVGIASLEGSPEVRPNAPPSYINTLSLARRHGVVAELTPA